MMDKVNVNVEYGKEDVYRLLRRLLEEKSM